MIAEARALASIPDELTSVEAAPLLCAGLTTFNALRNAGLRAGDLVAIQGVVVWATSASSLRDDGIKTVALNRGKEKEKLAKDLGAHLYIDTSAEDPAAILQRMGGADAILATAPKGDAIADPDGWSRGPREADRRCCAQRSDADQCFSNCFR